LLSVWIRFSAATFFVQLFFEVVGPLDFKVLIT
jgi:hypothetical protein